MIKMIKICLLICCTMVTLAAAGPGTNVTNFYNVIFQDGADPWIYKHTDRWYYMPRTTSNGIGIWRARTFTALDTGASILAWSLPGTDPACAEIWAPELHYLQSKWYIYFAAITCDRKESNRRMFVLENTNPDPFNGSFVFKGQITDSTNKWAIDGTPFTHPSGQLYFSWSGWEGDVMVRQILYIAKMSNPWTITGPRVEIARPIYSWEKNHAPHVNEAPQFIVKNGVISLVYSASASWTNDYCLGLITASNTSNPLNATSWKKRSSPVFKSANGIFGPGHNGFTKSFDGKEDWIIYHSARFNNSGWTRQIRAQKFTWKTDSTPNFGSPANPNSPITIPSGDPARLRFEAENATFVGGPNVAYSSTASKGMKVGYIDYATSSVTFDLQAPIAGTYVIVLRTGNGSSKNATASHLVSVNGGTAMSLSTAYSGWNNWGVVMVRYYLRQGSNTLTCTKGNNYAEIDTVDIFPNPS